MVAKVLISEIIPDYIIQKVNKLVSIVQIINQMINRTNVMLFMLLQSQNIYRCKVNCNQKSMMMQSISLILAKALSAVIIGKLNTSEDAAIMASGIFIV
jgi:hypothetical protein